MTDKRDLRSQALDLLRFPLAAIIVVVHMLSGDFVVSGSIFETQEHLGYHIINDFVMAFLKGQSVPIYYFISGYVFFLGIELTKEKYIKKISNRIRSLFIPYLIWNFIFIVFYLIRTVPFISSCFSGDDIVFDWRDFFASFWWRKYTTSADFGVATYPINYPLWFLRDLMIVVVCTPAVSFMIKHFKAFYILFLGIVWFVANLQGWGRLIQLSNAFFFFSFGSYMSINKKDMLVEFGRFTKLSIILFILTGCGYMFFVRMSPETAHIIMYMRILVGLLFAYNLAVYLLKKGYCKVNKFLASSSFFIYLSHAWVFERVRRLIFSAIDLNSDFWIIVAYLLTVFVTISLLLLAYYCGKRFMPGIFKVMIGGR